jgi:uncharacterized protein (TIGR02118 family)
MNTRIIFPLRRRGHLSRDKFQEYWLEHHAPLVARHAATLGIVAYQQVHTMQDTRPTEVDPFDGVAELWVDVSRASSNADDRHAASAALLDDERNFIDHRRSPIWVAEEDELLSGPKEGVRITALLKRKAGTTRQEFRAHWHDIHGPWALRHPEVWGFTHYVQNHTPLDAESHPLAVERGAPEPFDGVSEIYRKASTAPAHVVERMRDEILADELNFLDVANSPVFTGKVHVIL